MLNSDRRPLRMAAFFLLLAVLLTACSRTGTETLRYELYVFGTLVNVTLWEVQPEEGEVAITELNEAFQRMHHDWHAWKPGPLVDINRAIARGESTEVIPSLVPIIEQSKVLERRSDGLFNPAIGGLLSIWGFQSDQPPSGPPPASEAIAEWVEQAPSMENVHLDGNVLTSDNPAVQLDFGAFAKGYAVDLAIRHLRERGIENAIVNAGGDLRAIGSKGEKPWRVGVRHPQGGGVMAAIEVRDDESVFTSGNYERYREHEGVHYPHILDPRTGMPIESVTSVTVIHDNGAEADAAATALIVAGPKEWHRIAEQMGIRYVMLVDDGGTIYMNPAMAERVDLQGDAAQNVELSQSL
ncbi:FAD:protein FMN transferase [Thiohalomonas denitrificans]|uniref:FAD:protein FMN transferase n=1 Tax=Thiohalomonas denitrificans TaxID=415747 RepID=A0A1G5Q231_9GAMM|nr:FAD:protein FMN transferase [Thiohalomonas denitrificans]SCZ55678.1 thiamine biosynthesis lipoprotein [Thiohalomonas denitrificans]